VKLDGPSPDRPQLTAYRVEPRQLYMPIVRAPIRRSWMDRADFRHPYRCLPLNMANQAGWLLLNSHTVEIRWTGEDTKESMTVTHLGGSPPYSAVSHFGYGIITFHVPYLFRTSRGYNLLVRGPANCPKDGAFALEGLVETDWSIATFLMNWRITRSGQPIRFERGEPLCMLVPQRRGELESFSAEIRDLDSDPEVEDGYRRFRMLRDQVTRDVLRSRAGLPKNWWQQHYAQGAFPDGPVATEHQYGLQLRDFVDRSRDSTNEPQIRCQC
jgi:hypothetical protein